MLAGVVAAFVTTHKRMKRAGDESKRLGERFANGPTQSGISEANSGINEVTRSLVSRSVLGAILVSTFLVGCDTTLHSPQDVSGPYLEETEFNIGTIKTTDEPIVDVVLHNKQQSPCRLTQIELNCGCLRTDFQPTEIMPGDAYKTELRLKATGLGAGLQRGRFITDPPQRTPLEFVVKYHVKQSEYVVPSAIALGTIAPVAGEWPIERTLLVRSVSRPLKSVGLPRVDYLGNPKQIQRLNYSVSELAELKEGSEIRLTIVPREWIAGEFTDKLRITIDTDVGPAKFDIVVFGFSASSDLEQVPESVSLPRG